MSASGSSPGLTWIESASSSVPGFLLETSRRRLWSTAPRGSRWHLRPARLARQHPRAPPNAFAPETRAPFETRSHSWYRAPLRSEARTLRSSAYARHRPAQSRGGACHLPPGRRTVRAHATVEHHDPRPAASPLQSKAGELQVNWIMEPDPAHPIIESPWLYSIAEFRYYVGRDGTEPFIDLVLERESVSRRLRFWSPQDLRIEEGCFPTPTGGMAILDVSKRRLNGLRVLVTDFEGTRGSILFWARDVVDLDSVATS